MLDFGWALQSSFQLRSHAGQLRQNWGQRWQPPQQIQRLSDDQISALAITKRYVVREDLATWRGQTLDTGYRHSDIQEPITNNQSKNLPRNLLPANSIEHLFFYKIFLCLVYCNGAWKIYYTPDEEFGGWVGKEGGRDKVKNLADEICSQSRCFRPIASNPEAVYSVGNWGKDSLSITNCKLPIV